jgi:hypothetical protein
MRLCKGILVAIFAVACLFMVSQPTRAVHGAIDQQHDDQFAQNELSVSAVSRGDYVVIAWNDLGMHCISPRFEQMAILPPFNNLIAQVIKRGNPPQILTSGLTVDYSIPNNTTVAGKTDFWQFAGALFGTSPPSGIGLTGNGLSGQMHPTGDHFEATGIPVLPLDDQFNWNPYQQAVVQLRNSSGQVLARADVVLPVSDEMHCDKCHLDGGPGAPGIRTGSVESNILTLHDNREGTSLISSKPVLCASCHSDNALGTPGVTSVPSLSLAMHRKHSTLSTRPACYDCHPGAVTQCNRSALEGMGPRGTNPRCERCHGGLADVASSILGGRRPWLEEPSCAQCHGRAVSTGSALYRNSRGHGGVYCSACHNSPHAWYPSRNALDNKQPIALQGRSGPISNCSVCHTNRPSGENPHEAGSSSRGSRVGSGDSEH